MKRPLLLSVFTLIIFSSFAQSPIVRTITIDQSNDDFTLFCRAKLEGLNNIDTIDEIKTDFGKKIDEWNYDPITGQVLLSPKAFGGITGFFNLKFVIGAAVISQQLYSKAHTFLVESDVSLPEIGEIQSVLFCGKDMPRYQNWGKNGLLVTEFDVSTNCQEKVEIVITYIPKQ